MTQGIEVTDPEGYRSKLDGLLGSRDPLEVLRTTPGAMRRLFDGESTAVARTRPFEGKWTPLEVVGHLIDVEWSFAWRLRIILSQDRPPIQPMEQDRWVAAQAYNEQEPGRLLDDFASLREINLRLWERLTPEELERVGVHAERGEESLGLMRAILAGHDLSHLDQARRYFAAIGRDGKP